MAKMIAITSGKGGVGKTGISVNMAIHLAEKGYRTCLFDADLGLANINILLNLYPKYNLSDVLLNKTALDHILIRNVYGIDIIPGSSGIEEMADLSRERLQSLMTVFSQLDHYDYMIFDTSAGTSKSVISLCMASEEIVVVIVPEPTSLTDAYALLKILAGNGYAGVPKVLVNQSKNSDSAKKIFEKFAQTVHKYLSLSLAYIGHIPKDPHVVDAVTRQKPVLALHPDCKASKHIRLTSDDFITGSQGAPSPGNLDAFLRRYLKVLKQPLTLSGRSKEASTRHIDAQEDVDEIRRKDNAPSSIKKTDAFSEKENEKPVEPPLHAPESSQSPGSGDAPPLSTPPPEADVKNLLASLVDTMNGISQELQAIRMVAELMAKGRNKSDNSMSPSSPPASPPSAIATPKSIPLDFQAYKERQKRS